MPRALDAPINDRTFRQWAASVRADGMERMDGRSDPDQHEVVDPGARPGRRCVRQVGKIDEIAEVETNPLRAGTPEGVPADHVAQVVHDLAADEGTSADDQERDARETDWDRSIDRSGSTDHERSQDQDEARDHEG